MQPNPAFIPWAWPEPGFTGANPTSTTDPDAENVDSLSADEQAHADLSGYAVEATDGSIGSVDDANYQTGNASLVVDTGPWIFGRKVLLPAGTVERIDHDDRRVYVNLTKHQIKDSPEYDQETFATPEYRDRVGDYYIQSHRNPSTLY